MYSTLFQLCLVEVLYKWWWCHLQVKEYDTISRLDQWLTTMLLRVKKTIQDEESDLRWLYLSALRKSAYILVVYLPGRSHFFPPAVFLVLWLTCTLCFLPSALMSVLPFYSTQNKSLYQTNEHYFPEYVNFTLGPVLVRIFTFWDAITPASLYNEDLTLFLLSWRMRERQLG